MCVLRSRFLRGHGINMDREHTLYTGMLLRFEGPCCPGLEELFFHVESCHDVRSIEPTLYGCAAQHCRDVLSTSMITYDPLPTPP